MRPIPEKIKTVFGSYEQLEAFQYSLQTILEQYTSIDKPSNEQKMVGVNLAGLLKKVSKRVIDGQTKTTIHMSASESLAYLIAYQSVSLVMLNQYHMIKVREIAFCIDKAV